MFQIIADAAALVFFAAGSRMAVNGWLGRNNFIGLWRSFPFTGPPHPADGAKDAWRIAVCPVATAAAAGALALDIGKVVGDPHYSLLTYVGWTLDILACLGLLVPAGTLYLFVWPRSLVPPVLRGQPGHVQVWIAQWRRHGGSSDGRHEG